MYMELMFVYCDPETQQMADALASETGRTQPLDTLAAWPTDTLAVFVTPPYQTAACWTLLRQLDKLPLEGRLCSCVGVCAPACGNAAQAVQRVSARLLRRGAMVCLPGVGCVEGVIYPGVDCCGGEPGLNRAEFAGKLSRLTRHPAAV